MLTFSQTSTPTGKSSSISLNTTAAVVMLFGLGSLAVAVAARPSTDFTATLSAVVCVGLGSLLFYVGRPWTLELDESARRYALTSGYWPLRSTKRGSFDDIDGVNTLLGRNTSGGPLYLILIKGRKLAGAAGLPLEYYASADEANARSAELAQQLGVLLLEPTRTSQV
jgi:hypothetical protein